MEASISICARLAEISTACQFVETLAEQAGLDTKAVHHCQLVCDEICTNIIEHGYGRECDDQVIDVACVQGPSEFTIVITDDSAPFNPLSQKLPDPQTNLAERGAGGWGLHFMTTLMDDVIYDQDDGRNRLTLIKFLV